MNDIENRLSNVSFLIWGFMFLCLIFSCLGAFDHFLLRGYAIPGIPLEYQHEGASYDHGFDTTDCIPDSVGCAPSDKSDFWEAGQKVNQSTGINPLEILFALIVVCVVLYVLASLIVAVSRAKNKITKTDPIPAVTDDGYQKGYYMREDERRMKAEAMAIPLMIFVAFIVLLVYWHIIQYCVHLYGQTNFCF